jgi:hypothetical protein
MPMRDENLADWFASNMPEQARPYQRGKVLYWQGDPVENLFVVQKGALIVGGAPLSKKFAEDIQADAYGATAPQAVEIVVGWIS